MWKYRDDLIGRLRNRVLGATLPPIYNWLTGAARVGVSPLMLCFATPQLGLAHIAQQPAFFDFPRRELPAHFHYSGPWHKAGRDADVPFPWEWLDGRPLVYGSMGTIQNGVEKVYRAMADAVRDLDVQLVIALGAAERSLDVAVPSNVLVVPYAPQLRLLERAAVTITHAGYNTTIESLTQGVPMVCLPVTNDQPGVARRVEWLGAGEVLPIRRVTAERLRTLLKRVLKEPSYREAALQCRDEIQKIDGLARAVEIIEQAFRTRQAVLRETTGDPA
jgi:MGT family glycosyltransferase